MGEGFMRTRVTKVFAVLGLVYGAAAYGQMGNLPFAEAEKRNAAASFALSREASLLVLRDECGHLMRDSNPTMEAVVTDWYDRNRPEMEAALVWTNRYFAFVRSQSPEAHKKVLEVVSQTIDDSARQYARLTFARKMPDTASCEQAAKPFTMVRVDLKSLGLTPGFAQFAEIPETLARIRAEPGFTPPTHVKVGLERFIKGVPDFGHVASREAANALGEQGDGAGRVAALKSMVQRGDGDAALALGDTYLNGRQVAKDITAAYQGFYAAWNLSGSEGLNALGAMLRDGLAGPANTQLAGAAFYLAKASARTPEAMSRASGNLQVLQVQLTEESRSKIACMTYRDLNEALQAPIAGLEQLVKVRPFSSPDQRLGAVIRDLSESYKAANCQPTQSRI